MSDLIVKLARELIDQNGGPIQSDHARRIDAEDDYVMVRMVDFRALADAIVNVPPPRCTCWIGDPTAHGGSSVDRMACAVHGTNGSDPA